MAGTVPAELEQVLGRAEVLEPVQPEVATGLAAKRVTVASDSDDLPAVRGRADPGGTVDVEADVALVGDDGVAGVDADPDADRGLRRSLDSLGCRDGVVGPTEGDEERVALRVDLDAVVRRRSRADPPVLGQQVGVVLAVFVEQTCRALDVGEQEGDRAGREIAHRPIMTLPGRSDPTAGPDR